MAIRSPPLTPLAHPFVLGVALLTISISWVDGQSCSSFVDLSMPVCSSSQRASVNLPNRGLTSLPSATSGCLTGSSTIGTCVPSPPPPFPSPWVVDAPPAVPRGLREAAAAPCVPFPRPPRLPSLIVEHPANSHPDVITHTAVCVWWIGTSPTTRSQE